MSERLAVDIGGTFVDAIRFDRDESELTLEKTSTTPESPTEGVLNSIDKLDSDLEDTEAFIHGTTLGINALLEREGATTGIITNDKFRDVFEIGRFDVQEDEMYNINYQKPDLIVPRRRRVGVPGRLDENGDVIEPIDEESVAEAAQYLVDEQGVESIAICLLHSYQNPDHERTIAEIVKQAYPDVSVSISSDITREFREYERTSTTVIDAYIKPIFESYVESLDSSLSEAGFDGPFFLTRSGGGAISAERSKTAPVETILSGPAGGLIGAARVGEITGRDDILAVDMGGTSLDACVVEDGSPAVSHRSSLEHYPLLTPVYDIRTIGAGGGSIAWLDGNLLKVGPKSAGASPGPICYGEGGTEPTVTDAALALGYIDPEEFLGGEMELRVDAAHQGIEQTLADPLGSSVVEASRGVFDVTLANTVSAIREITVEKGLDPRDFSLLAYGGAGPLFNPLIAREMGINEIIIPQSPSVFSAWGMLMSDIVYDFSMTDIVLISDISVSRIENTFASLEKDARERLESEGFADENINLERSIEMRYLGQEHTVEIGVEGDEDLEALTNRFEKRHDTRYGHTMDDPAELVHYRIRAIGRNDKPEIEPIEEAKDTELQPTTRREAYCFAEDEMRDFDIYHRSDLQAGHTLVGPSIIQEPTTNIVIHSDQTASVDPYGHVIIQGGGE